MTEQTSIWFKEIHGKGPYSLSHTNIDFGYTSTRVPIAIQIMHAYGCSQEHSSY